MELTLPGKLHKALEREAQDAKRTLHAHLVRKLENVTPPIDTIDPRPRMPAAPDGVSGPRARRARAVLRSHPDAYWWVKLTIDIAIRWHGAWCRNWASC